MTRYGTLLLLFTAALFGIAETAWSATGMDEARRHFDRGMAAVEMAKTPEDYEPAIREFKQARDLAPNWADVYYNLGLVQEKAGKYRDAVSSLRRYLQLDPRSPDAAAVRSLINKAEFKAEQTLTEGDVVAILATLDQSSIWQFKGISKANLFNPQRWVRSIRVDGRDSLQIIFPSGHCGSHGLNEVQAKVNGKTTEFGTIYCQCSDSTDAESCAEGRRYYLEVVSRNKVKVRMKYWYPRMMGGGTDEARFEFVRR